MTTIRPKLPVLLLGLLGAMMLIALGFSSQPGLDDPQGVLAAFRRFLILPFAGELWTAPAYERWLTLLVAPLLHVHLLHALINAALLWTFGRRLERKIGWENMLLLTLAAGLAGSCAELATGNWPALGATSIVYAYFGFTLTAAPRQPLLLLGISRTLVRLMNLMLVVLLINGLFIHDWPTGVAGPLAGLALGILAARLFVLRRWRKLSATGLLCLGALAVLAAEHASWLPAWRLQRAAQLFKADRPAEALGLIALQGQAGDVPTLNLLAWLRATAPDPLLRDGAEAIALARQANARTAWRDPSLMDTLAAAYAEAGDWPAALAMERMALAIFDEEPALRNYSPETVEQLTTNLESIERREPIRDAQAFGGAERPTTATTPRHQLVPRPR